MELQFSTITSVDILTWVIGIMFLRWLTGSTPLQWVNHRLGDKKAGVNLSERGKGGLGSGGSGVAGNGRGRMVRSEDVNAVYEGRFTRRAALLEKQRRDNADRITRNSVQTCCRALRESRTA